MRRDSKARIAVVTGGTSGIGLATSVSCWSVDAGSPSSGKRSSMLKAPPKLFCQDFGSERVVRARC